MIQPIFYSTSIIFSTAAIFLIWHLGLKPLMLDDFRDSLFAIRDRLYSLGRNGRISCDSSAYRGVEWFINSVIQYAHRFTFISFILSLQEVEEQRKNGTGTQFAKHLATELDEVGDFEVRRELQGMVREVTVLVPRYIARSSFAFMLGAVIYIAFRSSLPLVGRAKQTAVLSFESETISAAESERFAHA